MNVIQVAKLAHVGFSVGIVRPQTDITFFTYSDGQYWPHNIWTCHLCRKIIHLSAVPKAFCRQQKELGLLGYSLAHLEQPGVLYRRDVLAEFGMYPTLEDLEF